MQHPEFRLVAWTVDYLNLLAAQAAELAAASANPTPSTQIASQPATNSR